MNKLQIQVGQHSESGPRPRNEDRFGVVTPEGAVLAAKGALLAVADGVGGAAGGLEAARYTVRGLMADYYATPDTWPVSRSLQAVLEAVNAWVHAEGRKRRELAGMACTLSALVLKGRRFHVAHVGDSRIYRLRGEQFEILTTDHVWDRPDLRHVLTRAVGLESHLPLDYREGDLAVGDRFLILSDGVWGALTDLEMHQLLLLHDEPESLARALVRVALNAGGQDNATAVVVRIESLPAEGLDDLLGETRELPLPPGLKPGQVLDDYEVETVLHRGNMAWLYVARDRQSRRQVLLKAPSPLRGEDPQIREGFLREEWLGKRVLSPHVAQVLPVDPARRSALYYVMAQHPGSTLAERLEAGQHFGIPEVIELGRQLLSGLGALHRLEVLHRDIKPDNLLLSEEGQLRILDLGVARSVVLGDVPANPGTPSYMAPERFSGSPASVTGDLYAVGVTLYHLLTRRYPYGEIEPFQHPNFRAPTPASRYRAEIPAWLDQVLLRACARDPADRFETVEEFALALARGVQSPLPPLRSEPLLKRDPLRFWRGLSLILALVCAFLLYLLILRD